MLAYGGIANTKLQQDHKVNTIFTEKYDSTNDQSACRHVYAGVIGLKGQIGHLDMELAESKTPSKKDGTGGSARARTCRQKPNRPIGISA